MRIPDLKKIEKILQKGKSFTLTDSQYERKSGAPLPKNKSYLLNRSAIARLGKQYGYSLTVQEKTVTFVKEGQ